MKRSTVAAEGEGEAAEGEGEAAQGGEMISSSPFQGWIGVGKIPSANRFVGGCGSLAAKAGGE